MCLEAVLVVNSLANKTLGKCEQNVLSLQFQGSICQKVANSCWTIKSPIIIKLLNLPHIISHVKKQNGPLWSRIGSRKTQPSLNYLPEDIGLSLMCLQTKIFNF